MNTNKKLGRLVQVVRKKRGLTQSELAKTMKTSQSAINLIERGKHNLSLDTIKRLSETLGQPFLNLNENKVLCGFMAVVNYRAWSPLNLLKTQL